MLEKRFTLQNDGDGSWTVFDGTNLGPATIRSRTLVGLAADEAKDAANLLNMIAGFRQQTLAERTAGKVPHPFLLPIR